MIKTGQLLIAETALTGDFSFSRSIILITEHSEDGSMGFIINKKTDLKLSDILPDVQGDFPLFKGGPVDQDNLYYIHKIPDIIPGGVQIKENMFWGGNFEELYSLLKKDQIRPEDIKFFLGYSGWMPDQLISEIESESWIITDNHFDIFADNDSSVWKKELERLGGNYLIWANSPENPNYN